MTQQPRMTGGPMQPGMGGGQPGMAPSQPGMSGGLFGGMTGDQIRQTLAQRVLSGEMSSSDARFVLDLAAPEQQPVDPQIASAAQMMQNVGQRVQNLGLSENPVLAKIQGGLRNVAANMGLDPEYDYYRSLQQAYAIPLARAMGESGALSDLDVARWQNYLPQAGMTQSQAQTRMGEIMSGLNSQVQSGAAPSEAMAAQGLIQRSVRNQNQGGMMSNFGGM